MVSFLGELWHYRGVVFFLAWRDIKIRYKQSVLGVLWAVLQPLLTMLIFTVVFGRAARVPSEGVPYAVFSYTALVAWTYFATSVSYSSNSLVANANLVTKVYFPRAALPLSGVLGTVLDFVVAASVAVVLLWANSIALQWSIVLWLPLFGLLVMFAFAASLLLSALNVRYRDVKHVVPFTIQLGLFVTPVIYPPSLLPERFRSLIWLNPMAGIIDSFRAAALPGKAIDWAALGAALGLTLLLLLVGILYFRRAERAFADVI